MEDPTRTRSRPTCRSSAGNFHCELPRFHEGVHRCGLGVDVFVWDDDGNSRWFRGRAPEPALPSTGAKTAG